MLTTRFIHLHIPRSAGGTFRTLIYKLIGNQGVSGCPVVEWLAHQTWTWYEQKARKAGIAVPPTVVFVRNPYEWYVSLYLYIVKTEHYNGLDLEFVEWMEGLREGRFEYHHLRTLTHMWTAYGGDRATHIGRFEHLERDMVRIVSELLKGIVVPERIPGIFRSLPRRQRAEHPLWNSPYPYREFHTPQTRRWVEEWDAELLERFEYQW